MKTIAGVTPLINGFEFGWSNTAVLINGVLALGITAIDYSQTTEFENLMGYGNMTIARGVGNYSAEASITLYKSEILSLQEAARKQNVSNRGEIQEILPFDILVSFSRPDGSGISTDVLKNCQFTNNEASSASGQTSMTTQLKLIISHIEWGKI